MSCSISPFFTKQSLNLSSPSFLKASRALKYILKTKS